MKDQHISSLGFRLEVYIHLQHSCECNIAVAVGIAVISPAQSEDNIGVIRAVLHCLNTIQTLNGLPNAADRQR